MSNTSEFRVYHSLWCGCWPDLLTLRLQDPFQPKHSRSCRFHAQRFLATEDTAGGAVPGPFVTDMSLNIMAIRMPIAGATSFYQNVQVCNSQAAAISKPAGRCRLSQSASALRMPAAAGLLAQSTPTSRSVCLQSVWWHVSAPPRQAWQQGTPALPPSRAAQHPWLPAVALVVPLPARQPSTACSPPGGLATQS